MATNLTTVLAAIGAISVGFTNLCAFPFTPRFNIGSVVNATTPLPASSWEFGTYTEALLELYDPQVSVFGDNPFPVPTLQRSRVQALSYLAPQVRLATGYNALTGGAGGAAGDPASMGVGAVLLGKTDPAFARAANETVNGLLRSVPRFWNGAISHRVEAPELWADFVYMVPPFLAYYAADTQNEELLKESVRQCTLYRQVLQANITADWKGVWSHIIGHNGGQDLGLWSTGNAWAAAGMTRVLATVMKSNWTRDANWKQTATSSLTQYIKEIIDGAMHSRKDQRLLRNYFNDFNSRSHGFGEIAGSALLAATAYRMVVLQPSTFTPTYVGWADSLRQVLGGQDSSGSPHITPRGIVRPVVNPYAWLDPTPYPNASPEGNSFVILLYAAWRDCVRTGICGANLEGSMLAMEMLDPRSSFCRLRSRKGQY